MQHNEPGRGAKYLSGQRPMPGSEVSRAEVLKASTDTLLNAEAERLPDTPAPDEVAQPPEHFCTYPDCRCHPDKLEGWCAKGLPTPISLWRKNTALTARVAGLERMLLAVYYRKDDGLTDEDFAAVIALVTSAPRKGADQ